MGKSHICECLMRTFTYAGQCASQKVLGKMVSRGKNVDIVGIDPTTSRMRTTRSTTEPNARTDTPHAKSTNKYASYKRL